MENFDNKKIIQMVAIIGILCVVVGVATRIRQNNLKTLDQIDNTTTLTTESDDSNVDTSNINTTVDSIIDENVHSDSTDNTTPSVDNDMDEYSIESDSIYSNITAEEYDAFYYIDLEDDMSELHILYFNDNNEISEGKIICQNEVADILMQIFFKLYRNEYCFTSIIPLSEFDSEDDARASNNTYYSDGALYINPLYNPSITYDEGEAIVSPSEALAYTDREALFPFKIESSDFAYRLLIDAGFIWSGDRNKDKDYSEFYFKQ